MIHSFISNLSVANLVNIVRDAYETHSAVKRPNAVLCIRIRSATDWSKIINGCMQKHKREKTAALFLQSAF